MVNGECISIKAYSWLIGDTACMMVQLLNSPHLSPMGVTMMNDGWPGANQALFSWTDSAATKCFHGCGRTAAERCCRLMMVKDGCQLPACYSLLAVDGAWEW